MSSEAAIASLDATIEDGAKAGASSLDRRMAGLKTPTVRAMAEVPGGDAASGVASMILAAGAKARPTKG